ncbi:Methyltransferase-like protein 25 [Podila clonocystis]|nr:Methyltransferase-like protein 25 [Podila clonocystis]
MDSTPDESIYMDQDPVHLPTHNDAGRSFLPPGFDSMEQYLATLQEFLHQCEPITNLMIVDYFTTNSWETRMPQDWRAAFESPQGKLSSLDLMELVSLGKLREYKQSSTATQGTEHDASGPQDWPESLKEFVRMIKALSINRTLDPNYSKFKDTLDIHLIPGMSPKKLHEVEILGGLMASYSKQHGIGSVIDLGAGQGYLSRVLAFQHQLCVLGVDSNTIQTCGAQTTQKRTEKLFVNKTRNKQNSAKKKAQKQAKAKENKESKGTSKSKGQEQQQQQQPSQDQTSRSSSSSSVPQETSSTACPGSESTLTLPSCPPPPPPKLPRPEQPTSRPEEDETCQKISKKFKTETGSSASGSDSGQGAPNKKSNSNSRKKKTKKNTAAAKSTTSTIPSATTSSVAPAPVESGNENSNSDPATNEAVETPSGTKAPMDSSIDPQMAQTPGSNFQLQHITHTITAATLPTLLKEHFPKISKPSSARDLNSDHHHGEEEHDVGRWTLCGLHACGDLTSNMVKLFLESSATCLFSVGCCYHWITERYDKDGQVVLSDGSHGFPLSAVFNARKAHLGDHAKMIACQSPERWLPYQKESEDAIHGHYFRALLHKLMVEKGLYPGPPAIAPVLGRMGKHRLKGFPHYMVTALQRLKMPAEAITAEEAQLAYDTFLERDLYRIGILWALRTMLGPLFEGMILLDRAMHLHETIMSRPNTKTASVQLVAGFDVVESPRNMILIALKD